MEEDIIKYEEVKRVNKLLIERANKRLNKFVKGGRRMNKIKEYLLKICISSLSSEQVEKIKNHLEKNKAEKHLKVFDELIENEFFDFVGRMKTDLEKKE